MAIISRRARPSVEGPNMRVLYKDCSAFMISGRKLTRISHMDHKFCRTECRFLV